MIYIILGAVAVMAGVGAFLYWRIRKRRESRLISLVALLREPVTFDPVVLAKTASRVWNADLGDGTAEGEDGFVVGVGAMNTIMHGNRMFLINCIPKPYADDPDAASQLITDLRLRRLFSEHKAWFSCDAMGVDGSTTAEEIADWYRRLAKLFAELLDENCSLIYLPDSERAYAVNDDTERALLSEDPLAALQETITVPVIQVADDDPLMLEAVAKARNKMPEFVAAFEANAGENFSIKAPISHSGNTEFIWIEVTAVEGGQVYGLLANDPANLGPLKLGSKVQAPVSDINDWCYIDAKGDLHGAFTVAAVQEAARRQQKS
jgi:uncharacterized protein YegJ (DUF2314 family)